MKRKAKKSKGTVSLRRLDLLAAKWRRAGLKPLRFAWVRNDWIHQEMAGELETVIARMRGEL